MIFVTDNQVTLLIAFFTLGCVGTALLFCKPKGHRAWQLADLVWVVLGGIGALVAVISGIYTTDSGRIDRQIDIAYAATADFDREAARFRLRYCEGAVAMDLAALCDKVDFLSASTAENADLPLFLAITDQVAPLQGLQFFSGASGDMDAMMDKIEALDTATFLSFEAQDADTRAAISILRDGAPQVTADFLVLAGSYEALIAQMTTLQREWQVIQDNRIILFIQILALCLVSFAAPFRLGKSIVDLRRDPA